MSRSRVCPVSNRQKSARPKSEIGRSVNRLKKEQQVPLRELRAVSGATVSTLRRWAIEGRSGRYLDAVKAPGVGWVSSEQAVLRFLAEVRLVEAITPPPPATAGESTSPLLK